MKVLFQKLIIWLFERYAYDFWLTQMEKESISKYVFEQAEEVKFQVNKSLDEDIGAPF